ncbi:MULTISPECIES: hypothetical protein [Vibrio]|uniref:hypothetical protein n=1 Tax=Vibrio TaxID=662 RepID=UPI001FAF2AC2|nr:MULTISPECIES: hypothetical protein [Vibrio]
MSKEKLTEKKPEWLSFTEAVERITDNFMANRNEVFDDLRSDLVNPYIFLSNLKFALDSLPDGDIELYDLSNEIGKVIASLSSPNKTRLREVTNGIEHGFDLIRKERGSSNE